MKAKVIKNPYTATSHTGFRVPCAVHKQKIFCLRTRFRLFPFAPARCQECQSLTAAVHEGLLLNSSEGAPTSHRPGDAVEYPRLGSSSHLGIDNRSCDLGFDCGFRSWRSVFSGLGEAKRFPGSSQKSTCRVSWLQRSVQGLWFKQWFLMAPPNLSTDLIDDLTPRRHLQLLCVNRCPWAQEFATEL